MTTFQLICNIIVLLGGVAGAIAAIAALVGKPIVFFKKRKIEQHKKDKEELSKAIVIELSPKFDALTEQIAAQQLQLGKQSQILQQHAEELAKLHEDIDLSNEMTNVLVVTTKDLLRKAILNIYNDNKHHRTLTETERELVDELYKDYRAEHGNSYIEKKYLRMEHWTTIPDEDEQQSPPST